MDIELLLAHADDHRPVLEQGIPMASAAGAPQPAAALPTHLSNNSADPNSLVEQRWGVIAPEGPDGDRLLGLIEPLRKARQEAQQGRPVRVYRVPAGMDREQVRAWRETVYLDESTPERDLPRYLLILGDFDRVSLEVQQFIGSETFVGRLALPDDRGYEAYVDKVLRWERSPPPDGGPRAVFYTVRDGTAATTTGYTALMVPSVDDARQRKDEGAFPVKDIVALETGAEASADALLAQAASPQPTLLFSISHGLGAPRGGWASTDEQRALQGAISLGAGKALSAGDLASRPFLPGGVWFFLACYGAGTPSESAYSHWLRELKDVGRFSGRVDSVLAGLPKEGDRPFVAALPRAVLANPDGPLAVMGHVDLAWSYSFQDFGEKTRNRPRRFQGIFRALVTGGRAGAAHRELLRYLGDANTDLTVIYDEEAKVRARGASVAEDTAQAAEKANLWMLRQDLAGYILLGDPAARLNVGAAPAAPPPASAAQTPQSKLSSVLGFQPEPPKAAPTHDPAAMENAVLELLRGDDAPKQIAARAGVSVTELQRWADVYREAGRAALAKI